MRTFGKAVFFVVFAGFLFAACSSVALEKQMRFGIWAAEHDLWDEAVFRWKRVLAANPDSAAAHNNLAVAYEKKGLVEEARKEYELALKLAPDNNRVKFNYTKFKESLGTGDKPGLDKGKGKNEKK